MNTFLSSMLSGVSGEPSTMRVVTLVVVCGIMLPWAVISIRTNALQPISYEQVALVLGAMGMKAYQRGKEGAPIQQQPQSTTPKQP